MSHPGTCSPPGWFVGYMPIPGPEIDADGLLFDRGPLTHPKGETVILTDTFIEIGDRVPLHALTRALDMPRHKIRWLVNDLGLPMMRTDENEYTSKTALRELLTELAGTS